MNNGALENANACLWATYRNDPQGFAGEVLGSHWWSAQKDVATTLCESRRVAVKAANGVGKTYLAADLLLWFLYTHEPSVVLTTAPTWRQVESLLWEEVRRRHRRACVFAERNGTPVLPGKLLQTQLKLSEGHFAMGLSTDEPVRFQGFHAENLLIILDEACGIDPEIWEAVEGICVGQNNRVLAISNPLDSAGKFYSLFQNPRWKTLTISALDHPNVLSPTEREERNAEAVPMIPGAVTREAVEDRISSWCEETDLEDATGTLIWEGRHYRPNAQFRIRVQGEFPEAGENSLLARDKLATAQSLFVSVRETPCALAVDVARFGSDETAFALRRGDRIVWVKTVQGQDTMTTAKRALALYREAGASFLLVDETGVGGGVMDRINEERPRGLIGVQFGASPLEGDEVQFVNLRAQMYWRLKVWIEAGKLALPADSLLIEQLASLRYDTNEMGRIRIESKDSMKKRGIGSPDRADAVAMLMHPAIEREANRARSVSSLVWRGAQAW